MSDSGENIDKIESLTPEIGSYWLWQRYPCDQGNTTCDSYFGFQSRAVQFKKCPATISDQIVTYFKARIKQFDLTDVAQCVDDNDLYI